MSREAIYAALFAKVSAIPGIKTSSRRMRHFSDVPGQEQPALFQEQSPETVTRPGKDLPRKLYLNAHLWIYAKTDDHTISPAPMLNALIDAVEDALDEGSDPMTGNQTLWGLVSHCVISGKIETDDGWLDSQAIARIPIEMLVP